MEPLSFDHFGGKSLPHALAGFIITSGKQQTSRGQASAETWFTHCFPAQLHDGLYLIKSAAWLHAANASTAIQLCGSRLLEQTSASTGILQVRNIPGPLITVLGLLCWGSATTFATYLAQDQPVHS